MPYRGRGQNRKKIYNRITFHMDLGHSPTKAVLADGQGMMFGERGLENEIYMEKEKRCAIMKS